MSTVRFAGFSRLNGALKFRTAMDQSRAQQLAKLGDTEIDMIILPSEMTKNDAAKWVLVNIDRYTSTPEKLTLLTGLIKDENPFVKTKAVKKTAPVKKTQTVVAKNVTVKPTAPVVEDKQFSPREAAKIRAEFMKKLKIAYEAN